MFGTRRDRRQVAPVDQRSQIRAAEGCQIRDPACTCKLDLAQVSGYVVLDGRGVEESRQGAEPSSDREILIRKTTGEGQLVHVVLVTSAFDANQVEIQRCLRRGVAIP